MKLVTRFEAQVKPTTELQGLRRAAFNALAASEPFSSVRRNALASLETIERELAARAPGL